MVILNANDWSFSRLLHNITINPRVLTWAREVAGYSIEHDKVRFKKIYEWENGVSSPTYPQLAMLAEHYKRPIALFLFPEVPEEEPIEQSLRAISNDELIYLSPKVRFLFRKAHTFQIYLKELYSDEYSQQIKKVAWLKQDSTNISNLANKVRDFLSISIEDQKKFGSEDIALEEWRNTLANNGVYVFKEAFEDERVSGFCVYDEVFPIIYLNSSTSKTRQMFTLFHELAHLLLKQTFLDVYDKNDYWSLEKESISNTEWNCDKFAANFLIPDSDILSQIKGCIIDVNRVQELAKIYKVSRHVILRKLWDIGIITKSEYYNRIKEIKAPHKNKPESFEKSGGSYYNTKFSYLGKPYFSLVFKKYYRKEISELKAAEYLDAKVKSFKEMVNIFLAKEANYVHI